MVIASTISDSVSLKTVLKYFEQTKEEIVLLSIIITITGILSIMNLTLTDRKYNHIMNNLACYISKICFCKNNKLTFCVLRNVNSSFVHLNLICFWSS